MMERAEKAGLGVALIGHAALFALLSLRLLTRPLPVPPPEQAIEVSLAPDVALQQSSPAPAPPAPSEAPEQGAPEEEAVPEPTPAPPPPKAKPAPVKPAPPAAKPDADRLAAVVADAERADAARADKAAARAAAHAAWVEKVNAENAAKADAARAAAGKAEAARAAAAAAKAEAHAAWVEKVKAENAAKAAAAIRPRGSRLGNDFLKGLADTPAKTSPSAAAPGVMSAIAAANIQSAIQRQIQPCADRQVNPGPGAERIRVAINLKLNRDGSLAAPPRVVNHDGLDVDNRRYLDRVDDLAIAAFVGCAPLRGLPANLYDVPNGWRSITMRYKLPG